jgi:hypothetical protein
MLSARQTVQRMVLKECAKLCSAVSHVVTTGNEHTSRPEYTRAFTQNRSQVSGMV